MPTLAYSSRRAIASAQKMRRRPREHDQKQQQRMRIDGVRHRRPTENRRRRARRPADDDVLRRRAFQPARIDQCIADQREERQHGGQRIHGEPQHEHRAHGQHGSEADGMAMLHVAGRQRTMARARHLKIDALIQDVVERRRGTRGHGDAECAEQQRRQRHHARRREHHADDGGEHDQQAHLRLRQLQIFPPAGAECDGGDCGVFRVQSHTRKVNTAALCALSGKLADRGAWP